MFSFKKWLMSLALSAILTSPIIAVIPLDPNSSVISPTIQQVTPAKKEESEKYFHYYWNIFDKEIGKEISRRHARLKNLEEWNIMENYISRRQFDPTARLTPEDIEIMEDYFWDFMKDSGREFIDNTPEINQLENEIRSMFSYEIFGRSGEKNKDTFYSSELAEEERKEEKQQEEITAIEGRFSRVFGEGYEMHSGLKPYFHNLRPGLQIYTRIENFSLFGVPFRKAKLEINSEEQVKFDIIKVLDDDWSAGLYVKIDKRGGEEKVGVSLGRDFRESRARISFHVEQRDGKEVYAGVNYISIF